MTRLPTTTRRSIRPTTVIAWIATTMAIFVSPVRAYAEPLKPLTVDTLPALVSNANGNPTLIAFWSLDCMYCKEDMSVLDAFARKHRSLRLAIVSTDSIDDAETVEATLKSYGVRRYENWIFADPIPERVRSAFDPSWHGELPRTYLYIGGTRREASSGRISEATLDHWYATAARGR
ncbi:MAG TPA: TlpA family protein disulfide reductase [Pararobbsia sp.]|jgi:thiol-disulfide isomerase/thioredoxin|nr:TlpA family protein disulfide reductase [Pararobbsia sp.]